MEESLRAKRIYKQSRLPSVEEYVDGLEAIEPRASDLRKRLLTEQYNAPDHTVTAPQLAKLAEVKGGYPVVNAQYGGLGHKFCDETGYEPDEREGGGYRWWAVWSFGYWSSKGFIWEMHPQVAQALERLGWVASGEATIPEEIAWQGRIVEGASRKISVNAYERNREARRECLRYYGTSCAVCEIDLELIYGPMAQGFIHVHHLKPLSEIDEEYEVNPISDLRPVCPNCHAIIHLGGKTRTIEEVRKIMLEAEETTLLESEGRV